jgi:hypothetical protein
VSNPSTSLDQGGGEPTGRAVIDLAGALADGSPSSPAIVATDISDKEQNARRDLDGTRIFRILGKEPFMTLETTQNVRCLVSRGRMLVLGVVVALAIPACASKEKAAAGPALGMGAGMAPPPMTSMYDPSKEIASGSMGSPWGAPGAGAPSGMPTASANGSSFTR